MAGHFISELERARKQAAKPRPSLVRRLSALTATVWAIIGLAEFAPRQPYAPPVSHEAAVVAPVAVPEAPTANAPTPLPAPVTRRAAVRRERPSVPLNGAGGSHRDDGLYVLSAAEMADISQAAARNEHLSATLIVAEAAPEVAPPVAPLGQAATTAPETAETASDEQDQGRQSRRRIRRR